MLPAHGRRHNLSLVLQLLYSAGPMSRADLARRLGMSKVTVSDLVAELVESGHAVELGPVRPGPPRQAGHARRRQPHRPAGHRHRPRRPRGAARRGARPRRQHPRPLRTPHRRRHRRGDRRGASSSSSHEIVAAATKPILGIGVGTPGIVAAGGVVDTAPNLGWRDVPLRDLIAEATGLPVFVVNDADAAVHADYTLGDGGDDLVLVRIGRGVGCGLIVGGQRVRGAHFAAGEIGHVTVGTDGGAVCRCGKTGCLETWVSAPRLERALTTAGDDSPLREAGERLGIALAPVVAVLDLAEVVLSGPGHLLDGPLRDSVEQTLHDRLLVRPESGLRVRIARDADDIVLRGAAVLVLWDQLGVV